MSDPLVYISAASSVVAIFTGILALGRASAKVKQAALEKGRGQGMRDAEVSQIKATVDYHTDKIGELDDARQEANKVLAKLSEGYDWMKATLSELKEGVDEIRRKP